MDISRWYASHTSPFLSLSVLSYNSKYSLSSKTDHVWSMYEKEDYLIHIFNKTFQNKSSSTINIRIRRVRHCSALENKEPMQEYLCHLVMECCFSSWCCARYLNTHSVAEQKGWSQAYLMVVERVEWWWIVGFPRYLDHFIQYHVMLKKIFIR